MRFSWQCTWLVLAATSVGFAPLAAATLTVKGWIEPEISSSAPDGLATSPVAGRLACPPLTRLNLMTKKNEPFLLKSVSADKDNKEWSLETKEDSQWWSGAKVTAADVKQFLDDNLESHIQKIGIGVWTVPKHSTSVTQNKVVIQWQNAPTFGPYALNGISLYRRKDDRFECAGEYALSVDNSKVANLTLAKNRQSNIDNIQLATQEAEAKKPAGNVLEFLYSHNFSNTPWTRLPNEKVECDRRIDLPIATMITWNLEKPLLSAKFRQAMTHLLPRGSILRYGTAGFGDLVSGPILRGHPGYNKDLKVRPHDTAVSSKILDDLGIKRSSAHDLRTYQGKPLKLELYSEGTSNGVLEKVLFDSFTSLGIDLSFTSDKAKKKQADGILGAMRFPWPDENFFPYLHSKAPDNPGFWHLQNKKLDENLEQYAKSLTVETPEFGTLQKIHEILYDEEPFSLIVQHHGCLVLNNGAKTIPRLFIRDPDWFYSMIRNTL
jgi:ABC-type transport system substrate-binding protein